MAMKTINFKNGMHITFPDEEGRAVVFASLVGDGDGSLTLYGPQETVMALVLELAWVALKESHKRAQVVAFAMTMISVLADALEEKKDH